MFGICTIRPKTFKMIETTLTHGFDWRLPGHIHLSGGSGKWQRSWYYLTSSHLSRTCSTDRYDELQAHLQSHSNGLNLTFEQSCLCLLILDKVRCRMIWFLFLQMDSDILLCDIIGSINKLGLYQWIRRSIHCLYLVFISTALTTEASWLLVYF